MISNFMSPEVLYNCIIMSRMGWLILHAVLPRKLSESKMLLSWSPSDADCSLFSLYWPVTVRTRSADNEKKMFIIYLLFQKKKKKIVQVKKRLGVLHDTYKIS